MSAYLQNARLFRSGTLADTDVYELQGPQLSNRYFILSHEGTRHLMARPEVVGYDSYLSMLPPTLAGLHLLHPDKNGDLDILTILRGGLNYPMEEACHRCGIRVRDIHFLSCERIIENHVIKGLDIKYEKVRATPDRTLLLGDIVATGDTLRLCLDAVFDLFRKKGGSIRKIILFTIGGTRTVSLLEELTASARVLFPGFERFECFFYEGIFTVYNDPGVSGINTPDIDFGWKGGVISPEFRRYILDRPDTLLEKCIIYDGGARRYEIPVHFHEVLEYWEGILERADRIDTAALVREKLGYDGPLDFESWRSCCLFSDLPENGLEELWAAEQALLDNADLLPLRDLAQRRVDELKTILLSYE
ncbi:MAG: hypothetical protein IKX60_00230 [Bacteroidales bacterium]|nr:hypothetical protein [Bacteroidales bacterium]